MENKKESVKLNEIVNTIQWVQEYIIAIGEEHKQVYVDALERAMRELMKIAKE